MTPMLDQSYDDNQVLPNELLLKLPGIGLIAMSTLHITQILNNSFPLRNYI